MTKILTQYNDGKFILENQPTDGLIVIEANLQCIFELSVHQKIFKKAFPKTYKSYVDLCNNNSVYPGDCLFFTEDNYQIAMLVTNENIIGRYKDDIEIGNIYTEEALQILFENVKQKEPIISGIINRYVNTWDHVLKIIKENNYSNWVIYRE